MKHDPLADGSASFTKLLNSHMDHGTGHPDRQRWTPSSLSAASTSYDADGSCRRAIPLTTLLDWLKGAIPHQGGIDALMRVFRMDPVGLASLRDPQVRGWATVFWNVWQEADENRTRAPRKALAKSRFRLMPPELDPREHYASRRELEDVVAALTAHERPGMVAIIGPTGMGKSTLANLAWRDVRLAKRFPDGVLWVGLGEAATPDLVLNTALDWAQRVGADIDPAGVAPFEAVREALHGRRFLLVIDDVFDEELARWLLVGGSDCGLLVTSRYRHVAVQLRCSQERILELQKLSLEQSLAYLRMNAPVPMGLPSPRIALELAKVLERIDGLPVLLEVLANSMRSRDDDVGEVVATLEKFKNLDPEGMIRAGVEMRSRAAQVNFARLCILLPDPVPFSAEAAKKIMKGLPEKQKAVLKELKDFGLIRQTAVAPEAAILAGEADRLNCFTIHSSHAATMVPKAGSHHYQEACGAAAEHALAQAKRLERGGTDFESWLCHEDPAWHQAMLGYRHYLLKLGDHSTSAAFQVARAWLRSWWWWGGFTANQFSFIDQWLDWPQAGGGQWASEIEALKVIRRDYPKESEPKRCGFPREWERVRSALGTITTRVGLEKSPDRLGDEQSEVLGLLQIFEAECWRFGQRDFASALACYEHAEQALVRVQSLRVADGRDCWSLAWARYHHSDCLFETGSATNVVRARAACNALINDELAKPAGDQEVLARGLVLIGQTHLRDGEAEAASEAFFDASYWALRYMVNARLDDARRTHPDAYTAEHFSEICTRMATQLLGRADSGEQGAQLASEVAARIAARWDGGLVGRQEPQRAVGQAASDCPCLLAAQIFPRAFPQADWAHDGGFAAYAAECERALAGTTPFRRPSFHARAAGL